MTICDVEMMNNNPSGYARARKIMAGQGDDI